MKNVNFYSVIIGSEVLNGRRVDKHFEFLNNLIVKMGYEQHASFVIKDDVKIIKNIFELVKNDSDSVMFCFGGIGATPDDFTRACAADVFTDGILETNEEAKNLIVKQFGEKAYPYRVNMANIPKGAKLLDNPINHVAGFYLQNRFFFTPGFPQMAHPMVEFIMNTFFSDLEQNRKFRVTYTLFVSENDIIDLMKKVPKEVELSSLPQMKDDKRATVVSFASLDKELLEKVANEFLEDVKKLNILLETGENLI